MRGARGEATCANPLPVGGVLERLDEGSGIEFKSGSENDEGASASALHIEGASHRSEENCLQCGAGPGIDFCGRFCRISYEETIKDDHAFEAAEEADSIRASPSGSVRRFADKGDGRGGEEARRKQETRRFAGGLPSMRAKAAAEIIKMLIYGSGITVEPFTEVDFMNKAEYDWDNVCLEWSLEVGLSEYDEGWRGRWYVEITPASE